MLNPRLTPTTIFSPRGRALVATALALGAVACGEEEPNPTGGPVEHGLAAARITQLELKRPEGPTYLNERIPLHLGITASSVDSSSVAVRSLPVVVSFVDADDPDNENLGCASNAFDLELTGDGSERGYDAFIWPVSECTTIVGRRVALRVEIDPAGEGAALAAPLLTSSEMASSEVNQACRGAAAGCVLELDLALSPTGTDGRASVDLEFANFAADSSVMVFPNAPELFGEDVEPDTLPAAPSLRVQTALVLNGRDPYEAPVDPSRIPAELEQVVPDIEEGLRFGLAPDEVGILDDLPGAARIRYSFSAANDGETWLPLQIGADDGRLDEAVVTELTPGTANVLAHELYMDEAARTMVLDDAGWAGEELYTVRGCVFTDFEQFRGSPESGECRELEVVLSADSPAESGASSLGFDKNERNSVGSSRIGVESYFLTRNRIGIDSGVSIHGEGGVVLKGKIGRSFSFDLVKAHATARGPVTGDAGADMQLRLFGSTVDSFEQNGVELAYEEEMRVSRSRKVVDARFMFGPVPLNFALHAGGGVGITAEGSLSLQQGEDNCRERLPAASAADVARRERLQERKAQLEARIARLPAFARRLLQRVLDAVLGELNDLPERRDLVSCAGLDARVSPNFNLSADAFGGINVRIAKAGVEIDLTLVRVDFPLDSQLSFGLDVDDRFLVHAGTEFGLELRPLEGDLKLVGEVGFRRFKRRRTVTIASFSAGVIRKTLLERNMNVAEVLFR